MNHFTKFLIVYCLVLIPFYSFTLVLFYLFSKNSASFAVARAL